MCASCWCDVEGNDCNMDCCYSPPVTLHASHVWMADGLTLLRGQLLCFLSFDWMLRERKACRNCACSQIWVRPKRVRGRET